MPRSGKEYEQAVGDLLKNLSPKDTVLRGMWVDGPDGSRECDILVEGERGGKPFRILIECKDYNPSRNPVGIEIVDAIDSKLRDLNAHGAVIFSNARFTKGAARKAARQGIAILAALRREDTRVRFEVFDTIYFRWLTAKLSMGFLLKGRTVSWAGPENPPDDFVTIDGEYFIPWLGGKIYTFLGVNSIARGNFSHQVAFKDVTEIRTISQVFCADAFYFNLYLSGQWYARSSFLSASNAAYDWQRKEFLLADSGVEIGVTSELDASCKPVRIPPNFRFGESEYLNEGRMRFSYLVVSGLTSVNPSLRLDSLLAEPNPFDRFSILPDYCFVSGKP